jgi:hypothetical protein
MPPFSGCLQEGEMKNWNFREVTFISPNQLCDQDYGGMNTNGAIQWRGYWDEWYRNSLRNAKAERIRQLSAYANSDYQGECARCVVVLLLLLLLLLLL